MVFVRLHDVRGVKATKGHQHYCHASPAASSQPSVIFDAVCNRFHSSCVITPFWVLNFSNTKRGQELKPVLGHTTAKTRLVKAELRPTLLEPKSCPHKIFR